MGRRTNSARRRAEAGTLREKAAAARAAAARRERRRRIRVVVWAAAGVLALVAVIVAVGVTSAKPAHRGPGRVLLDPAVADTVAGVPAATLDAVGVGTVTEPAKPVGGQPLTLDGRPQVLFIGAEYCPYCAAERWALVQALSRFGSFSNLSGVHSSGSDAFPNTATFSFHGAGYRSDTVAFTGREAADEAGASLDRPTAAETTLWRRYTGDRLSFPFVDVAGRYVGLTSSFDPGVLKGLTMQQIAGQLADPTTRVAKAVDGAANVLTAAVCQATGDRPAAVCTAPGVVAARVALHG